MTGLIPKEAGIMEFIDAGLIAGTWNGCEGLERLTNGRDIDYFEI